MKIINKIGAITITESFYDWCARTDHMEYLKAWDYNKNKISPKDIAHKSKKRFTFKCYKKIHTFEITLSLDEVTRRRKPLCDHCNSFAQHGIDIYGENFLNNYWDYNKNEGINPWEISRSSRVKVFLFCQNNKMHGSYQVMCNSFTSMNSMCSYCSVRGKNGKPHRDDSLGGCDERVFTYWSDLNDITPYEVSPKSHKKVWWKCEVGIHDDYQRIISETRRYDYRCPTCVSMYKSSMLQQKVADFLNNSLGYTVKHEYKCSIIPYKPANKTNKFLPFDNEVVELRLVVEVHGKQHYDLCTWHTLSAKRNHTTPELELTKTQERDEYKKEYALSHGYSYLEIPYTYEKDDKYKKLIIEKINSIIQNL